MPGKKDKKATEELPVEALEDDVELDDEIEADEDELLVEDLDEDDLEDDDIDVGLVDATIVPCWSLVYCGVATTLLEPSTAASDCVR